MDPILDTIHSIITKSITMALERSNELTVKDAYTDLKTALIDKYGADSDLLQALNDLEEDPLAEDLQESFEEEVVAIGADKNPKLIALAKAILDELEFLPMELSGSGAVQIRQSYLTLEQFDDDEDW